MAEAGRELADHDLGQVLDADDRHLGDEDLAAAGEQAGVDDQAGGLGDAHDEAGHLGIGEGDRAALADLLAEDRDDRAARAQHVAEAGGGVDGVTAAALVVVGGGHQALTHELGGAHDVGGVHGLVGAGEDDALDAGLAGGADDVLHAEDVGLHGIEGRALAEDDVFVGGGVEDEIDAVEEID